MLIDIVKPDAHTYEIKGAAVLQIRNLQSYIREFGDNPPRCVTKELHFTVLQALTDMYDDIDDNVAQGSYELTVARDRILITEKL